VALGSARVSRAGERVLAITNFSLGRQLWKAGNSRKRLFWRDTKTNTRDACATQSAKLAYGWPSFFSVADHFAPDGALINASQALFHRRGEQRDVRNFAEMFGDEPDRFVRRHPVETVESG